MASKASDNNSQNLKHHLPNSSLNSEAFKLDAEAFKRAMSTCMRAIAGTSTLQTIFGHYKPSMSHTHVRLPEIPAKATHKDVAVTRGLSDSMGLRKAWHDPHIHTQFTPQELKARAIFDALEQTRIEAIGTLTMEGIAQNLEIMLADKYQRAHYQRIST
ncbi:cobaltochelatase subunit CobT, partial [Bartonella bacilliformis]